MAYKPKILTSAEGGTGASNTATSGKILIGDGTNFVSSTPTYPTAAGTSGNVLTSDGTNWSSSAAPGAFTPTLTYITSKTAAGGVVDFTSLSSTYKGYRFYLSALTPSAGDQIIMRVSTDNGSNFDSGNNYAYVGTGQSAALVSPAASGYWIQIASNATAARAGFVDVYFIATASMNVTFQSAVAVGTLTTTWMTGIYKNQANVDALRFTVAGANNLASGTIYQYGIS